jgi:hypothetical protein
MVRGCFCVSLGCERVFIRKAGCVQGGVKWLDGVSV